MNVVTFLSVFAQRFIHNICDSAVTLNSNPATLSLSPAVGQMSGREGGAVSGGQGEARAFTWSRYAASDRPSYLWPGMIARARAAAVQINEIW